MAGCRSACQPAGNFHFASESPSEVGMTRSARSGRKPKQRGEAQQAGAPPLQGVSAPNVRAISFWR